MDECHHQLAGLRVRNHTADDGWLSWCVWCQAAFTTGDHRPLGRLELVPGTGYLLRPDAERPPPS